MKMALVGLDGSSLRQTHSSWLGLRVGGHMVLSLRSSSKLG